MASAWHQAGGAIVAKGEGMADDNRAREGEGLREWDAAAIARER